MRIPTGLDYIGPLSPYSSPTAGDLLKFIPIEPLLQNNWQRSPFENPHTIGLYRATFLAVIAHCWVTCNLPPGQKNWA